MHIGLTYDLRDEYLAAGYSEVETAEFDREDTVKAIEGALASLGHSTDRIGNARALVRRLAAGHRWELVFNIAEGLNGIGREAQVPAVLDLYGIPYTFSDPLVMSLTLHKAMTKRVVRDAGLPTADFFVAERPEDVDRIDFAAPYFIKPLGEGTGKGVTPGSVIRRSQDLAPACKGLIDAYRQPALVETLLPGREFTVGVLGSAERSRLLGTIEVHLLADAEPEVYSYVNKERCEEFVEYRLVRGENDPVVEEAEHIALAAWRLIGCRDAGRIDLRCGTEGRPRFMEINPLAGLHPFHSDLPIICTQLGMRYEQLISEIVSSACLRTGHTSCRQQVIN